MGSTLIISAIQIPAYLTTMVAISLILILVAWVFSKKVRVYNIGKFQAVLELGTEKLWKLVAETMGSKEKAADYVPVLGTIFVFILFSNYSGMIPGAGMAKHFAAPTSVLTVTLGLGLCSLLLTFYFGIKAKGGRYFKHFISPYPFLLPLNLIDELTKPLSLALRLFGSVVAEEILIAAIYNITPYGAPIVFYFISIFFGALQAFIFTILTTIYISGAVE